MSLKLPGRAKPLILLVDDDPEIVELAEEYLRVHGFDVVTARDGGAGVEVLVQRLPDVLLVDLALPVIDGHEVVRRARSVEATARIPIIAYTGHAGGVDEAVGFDVVLTKPGKPHELLAAVRRVLGLPDAPPKSQDGHTEAW